MEMQIDIKLKKTATGKTSSNKDYWQEIPTAKQNAATYRLRCPKCHRIFLMSRQWGVWKGCPICWTELKYRKEKK